MWKLLMQLAGSPKKETRKQSTKPPKRPKNSPCQPGKHKFLTRKIDAQCQRCGWYLQGDGEVTETRTGLARKFKF